MPFEVNQVVDGVVKSITKFGAFIDIGGRVGLVHISEIADGYVKEVSDHLKEKDDVKVKIISLNNGKIGLSIRQAQPKPKQERKFKPKPKKPIKRNNTVTFDDQVSQFLKDSEERQQVLKKNSKKAKNRCFNR